MNPILAGLVIAFCWVAAQVFACLLFRVRGSYNNRLK